MNVFNRAVVILEVLSLVVVLIIAAVVPNTVLSRLQYTGEVAQTALESSWPVSYLVFLAIDIVLVLLLVVLLYLELRPVPKRAVTVRNVSGAKAELSTGSVEQSLQYRINEIDDVLKVRPVVRGKRNGVDIVIELETRPGIDVPAKTAEVSQAARDVVENKMGLKVASINVHMRHAAYGKAKPTQAPVSVPGATPNEPVAVPPAEEAVLPPAPDSDSTSGNV